MSLQHCYGGQCHELGGCTCECTGCAPAKHLGYRAGEAPPLTQAAAVDLQARCLAAETERDALRERLAVAVAAMQQTREDLGRAAYVTWQDGSSGDGMLSATCRSLDEALARIKGAMSNE